MKVLSQVDAAGTREQLRELVRALRCHLRHQAALGLEWLPQPAEGRGPGESLKQVREDLGNCNRCRLHRGRTHLVFGEGNPAARVVIVGEAPGQEEDLQGRPFVGAAGRLLDRVIAAMGWRRQDVYICNVIKCRPPKNRNPLEDEVERCGPFLRRQLRAIRPEAILTLGSFAAQFLLSYCKPISELRGAVYKFEGIPLVPTYHPAYLLRNPMHKRRVWQDIQMLMSGLNKQRPGSE